MIIRNLVFAFIIFPLFCSCNHEQQAVRPNIIYIITDQQAFDAMSCSGNPLVSTPELDKLAARGLRFDNAYCAFPLCVPSRTAMFSGHMPHESGIFVNTSSVMDEPFPFETLAARLRDNGYSTHYIGKWHLTIPRQDTLRHGFMGIDYPGVHGFDKEYARLAIKYLESKPAEPFFLVVSFMNPHDCCQLARKENLANFEGPIPPMPSPESLPELPDNFNIPEGEPDYIRQWQEKNSKGGYRSYFWDEQDFREYQWGYYRLVEKVDSIIGDVLNTAYLSEFMDRTTIFFSSDHGDGASRHKWNQKTSPYDETSRVPFIVAGYGLNRPGETDEHLVSSGLDLFPTICDLAGVEKPAELRGRSLKSILEGKEDDPWRKYVVTEISFGNWVDDYHLDTFPKARMLRTEDFKYVVLDTGLLREQLIDMKNDPGEMKNLVSDPAYKEVLLEHRDHLREWINLTNDSFSY